MKYDNMSVPSVWRTNRTMATAKVDALSSGGMEDIEIPAFLRRQAANWPAIEPLRAPISHRALLAVRGSTAARAPARPWGRALRYAH